MKNLPELKGVFLVGIIAGIIATGVWLCLGTILNLPAEVTPWLSGAFVIALGMIIGIIFPKITAFLIDIISVLILTTTTWLIYYYDTLSTIDTAFITNLMLSTACFIILAILGTIASIISLQIRSRYE